MFRKLLDRSRSGDSKSKAINIKSKESGDEKVEQVVKQAETESSGKVFSNTSFSHKDDNGQHIIDDQMVPAKETNIEKPDNKNNSSQDITHEDTTIILVEGKDEKTETKNKHSYEDVRSQDGSNILSAVEGNQRQDLANKHSNEVDRYQEVYGNEVKTVEEKQHLNEDNKSQDADDGTKMQPATAKADEKQNLNDDRRLNLTETELCASSDSVQEDGIRKPENTLDARNRIDEEKECFQIYCQPCSEKNERKAALIWCTICHETLCYSCNSHHEIFKATRNHTVISVSEYFELMSTLKDVSVNCESHPEKEIEYFCITHNSTCCSLCKSNCHTECAVKSIEDAIGAKQYLSDFEKAVERMEECTMYLGKVRKNRVSSLEMLANSRSNFFSELKIQRNAINEWLNKMEQETLAKFETMYKTETETINTQNDELADRQVKMSERLKMASKISPFKSTPTLQIFLAMLKVSNNTAADHQYLESCQDSLNDVSCCCKTSYEFLESEKVLKLTDELKFEHSPCKIKMGMEEESETLTTNDLHTDIDLITSSSVIEEEPTSDVSVTEETDDKPNDQGENLNKTTSGECVPSDMNSDNENQINATSNEKSKSGIFPPFDSQSRQMPPGMPSSGYLNDLMFASSDVKMKRIHSFHVQKSVSDIELKDVEVLSNGDLAILEKSTPRLLVYSKTGQKRGQVSFSDPPQCLTLIGDNQVAVTLPESKRIAIVQLSNMIVSRYIEVNDECRGICFANNNFIVNCVNHGLKFIQESGLIGRTISNMTGELYLCYRGGGDIYTIKRDSRIILRYNINNKRRSKFYVKGLKDPKGIDVDNEKNLFVSCWDTDIIYRKKDLHSSSEEFISDGIYGPTSISYDYVNRQIVVINDCRKSVVTFGYQ